MKPAFWPAELTKCLHDFRWILAPFPVVHEIINYRPDVAHVPSSLLDFVSAISPFVHNENSYNAGTCCLTATTSPHRTCGRFLGHRPNRLRTSASTTPTCRRTFGGL